MTSFRDLLPLLVIAALVPVVVLPVGLLVVLAGAGIAATAVATVAVWVHDDATPGSRAQRDRSSAWAPVDHLRTW